MPLIHKITYEGDRTNGREHTDHCHQPSWPGVDRLSLVESSGLTHAAGNVSGADLESEDAVHSRGGVVFHRVCILASRRETSCNLYTALLVILDHWVGFAPGPVHAALGAVATLESDGGGGVGGGRGVDSIHYLHLVAREELREAGRARGGGCARRSTRFNSIDDKAQIDAVFTRHDGCICLSILLTACDLDKDESDGSDNELHG